MKLNYPKTRNGNCPKCGFLLDGGDIFEELKKQPHYTGRSDESIKASAAMYGWSEEDPKRFSNIIGVETRDKYDGVSYWKCPSCKTTWNRWTGEEEEIKDK